MPKSFLGAHWQMDGWNKNESTWFRKPHLTHLAHLDLGNNIVIVTCEKKNPARTENTFAAKSLIVSPTVPSFYDSILAKIWTHAIRLSKTAQHCIRSQLDNQTRLFFLLPNKLTVSLLKQYCVRKRKRKRKVIFVLPVGWIYSCFPLKTAEYFIDGSKERGKPRFDLK